MSSNNNRSWGVIAIGVLLLVLSVAAFSDHLWGSGRAGPVLVSAPLPPDLRPAPATTASVAASTASTSRVGGVRVEPVSPPVAIEVPSHGVQAVVSAHALLAGGALFVPVNAREVSWWSGGAAPGSDKGTIVLVSHINFNGVTGVFSDLGAYQKGQVISLHLADGRLLKYTVAAAPVEMNKTTAATKASTLYDQRDSFGPAKTGRLLLVSCGGVFDNRTGHYESNIFVYALPA